MGIFKGVCFFAVMSVFMVSCTVSHSTVKRDFTKNKSRTKTPTHKTKAKISYQRTKPAPLLKEETRIVDKNKAKKNSSTARAEEPQKYHDTRSAIVAYARTLIGTKYVYGGRDQDGFDCSGFTSHVMKNFGVTIPGTSNLQSKSGQKLHWKNSEPGDLIFFGKKGRVNHVGIIAQNTGREIYVIHSTSSGGVRIDEVSRNTYWAPRIYGAISYLNLPQMGWESTGED
jgi:cell wall-associated NlpC family hydrolase